MVIFHLYQVGHRESSASEIYKEAGLSTNQPPDLPNILTYGFYNYKLYM